VIKVRAVRLRAGGPTAAVPHLPSGTEVGLALDKPPKVLHGLGIAPGHPRRDAKLGALER
jgi:hypothetical protein